LLGIKLLDQSLHESQDESDCQTNYTKKTPLLKRPLILEFQLISYINRMFFYYLFPFQHLKIGFEKNENRRKQKYGTK